MQDSSPLHGGPIPPENLFPEPGRAQRSGLYLVLLLALGGLVVGWDTFRFLCDDAYIAFRYVGNAVAGFGYTWNPPPFRPVEGYTSFFWVLLLEVVWRVTGLPPPETAAELGLFISIGTVVQVWRMARAVPLGARLQRWRPVWVALVLAGTLSNRTFLAWTSSGLETPLATFLLVSWVFAVARLGGAADLGRPMGRGGADSKGHGAALVCLWAALLALCRPDGLLFVVASLALLVLEWRQLRLTSLLPLGLVAVHLLWRHHTYGFWLPNTWYAKVGRAFVESGGRYLGSWLLEYAWWFAVGTVAVAGITWLARGWKWRYQPWQVAAASVSAHAGWYTLWVGGDHFEYRIYAHLVPLAWLALVAVLGALRVAPWVLGGTLALQLAMSLPIPWTHWAQTHQLTTRGTTHLLVSKVAPRMPWPIRGYARAFDSLQAWLIPHHVGMRHQEHAIYAIHQLQQHPARPTTAYVRDAWSTAPEDIPVMLGANVGVLGWALPQVAVIDVLGLNDAVVARNPSLRKGRNMAHERKPPQHYEDCFRPNARVSRSVLRVVPREEPLSAADVEACEARFWKGFWVEG